MVAVFLAPLPTTGKVPVSRRTHVWLAGLSPPMELDIGQ